MKATRRLLSGFAFATLVGSVLTGLAQDRPVPAPNLIYIINPTRPETLKVTTGGMLLAPNGKLYVYSRDKRAMVAAGDKSQIDVSGLGMLGGAEVTMGAKTNVKDRLPVVVARDPLGDIPTPDFSGAKPYGAVKFGDKQKGKLSAGLFDALEAGLGAQVELEPGIYSIKELYIHTGASVVGKNVMIYAGKIRIDSTGSLTLTAPTEGPHKDISLFISRRSTDRSTISTSATVTLTGTLYCPTVPLVVDSRSKLTCSHLVANTLEVATEAQLTLK